MSKYWTIEDFKIFDLFGAGENVAVFGSFTYRSNTRGKSFTSPFSVHAKVKNGKIVYFLFMEDTRVVALFQLWRHLDDPDRSERPRVPSLIRGGVRHGLSKPAARGFQTQE